MNYLIVDDEKIILEGMEWTLRDVVGEDAVIYTAMDPYSALDIIREHNVDIMFCDVDMPGMNGLKLADQVHEISGDVDIIFATGYAHYSLDAWSTTAQAFLLKPVGEQDVKKALDKVMENRRRRMPSQNTADKEYKKPEKKEKDIKVMCFGNFEISYQGKPIHFARKKSKEMLAYLIDRRGAMISTDEIRTILWEEDADTEEKKGYVRVLANDIRRGFEALDTESILINGQDCYSVDVSRISCDYFDFMEQNPVAVKAFQDEYMAQYSWAEATLGRLVQMKDV